MQVLFFPDDLVGQTLTGIARVLFERHGVLDQSSDGALELELNGRTVRLDSASDGEQLRVEEGRWEDPFAEPLSPENRAYVEEAGKWQWVDVSQQERYRDFIHRPITEVRSLKNRFGQICGVRISVDRRSLWFVAEGDECHVYWAHPIHIVEVFVRPLATP